MLRRMVFRILMVAGMAGAAMAMTPAPAQAGGHGHTSFAFGLNLGVPCCAPAYYAPAYYPPPVYYYPPPVAYAAPPAYYPSAPAYAPSAATVSNCRDYHGDATIDGQGSPFYGRACLGGDGRWHIVSQN